MSFITTAVAGPSRIPYGAAGKVATRAACSQTGARRSYAEQQRRRRGAEEEATTVGGVGVAQKPMFAHDDPKSYDEWVYKVGWKYKRPSPGHKARWLGNEVVSLIYPKSLHTRC